MHIHLDLVGGLSGDMFIGALLDCFPAFSASLAGILEAAGFADLVSLSIEGADDGTLTGTRFKVTEGHDAHGHHHRHYREICDILNAANMDAATRTRALDMFRIIAEAEASIHGKEVADVAFHEVGAWDSIADIICAAALINQSTAQTFSVSTLPLGRGRVRTAHGMLPVPAPATALILKGYEFFDDGIDGERITPTGAAILRHLDASQATRPPARLVQTGHGFGTKTFPGISNVARALVFEPGTESTWDQDQVVQLEFEIDDQTPEELADALQRLRAATGVIDVVQSVVHGKKGRQLMSVRALVQSACEVQLTGQIFDDTTTLGVRRQLVARSILRRTERVVTEAGQRFRVKVASRPHGETAKADQDDVAITGSSQADRRRIRQVLETRALVPDPDLDPSKETFDDQT